MVKKLGPPVNLDTTGTTNGWGTGIMFLAVRFLQDLVLHAPPGGGQPPNNTMNRQENFGFRLARSSASTASR
jgi:hypothetical protein